MTMLTELGSTWSSPTYEVRSPAGAPGAATVTAEVTLPDGTTAPVPVDNPATGDYTVDYLPPANGRYQIVITATGGILGTLVRKWRDTFVVSDGALLVSVDQALTFMRAQEAITSYPDRDYLLWLCYLATDAVERDTRRALVRRTISEEHDACGITQLVLNRSPVQSVSSIDIDGVLVDPSTYRLGQWGIIKSLVRWRGSTFNVATVTYIAGYTAAPECAVKMALGLIARNWQDTQQQPHPYSDDESAMQSFEPAMNLLLDPERRAYEALYRMAVA